ncbi:RHS repeat-associated core domain-containing protein [Streptomyces sp. NBC_00335]|uniref:RHS repeat domain-containing protein n=1 Tax=unclassified Streptomyces TaxID=2593676 RepID=UPI002252F20F|nr:MULTISPECIES: RHS repeat-associated core domain-containing protein [unclassified Streptomyces]MCX5409835.1 RHS repeat-associated core domain-containing protein [Streptomyces sp. NBC_00086]
MPVKAVASADLIAKLKAEDKAQAERAKANPKNTWPKPTTLKNDLSSAPAANSLVAVTRPAKSARAGATASGQATVQVLDQQAARKAGITGVLLTATAATPGTARVEVNYDSFASAIGGSWSTRLGLVTLPGCALTTPDKPECRTTTPLASNNDIASHELSANVNLAGAKPTATGSVLLPSQDGLPSTPLMSAASAAPTVLAVMATTLASPSGGGDYKATPLASSSSWQAGRSSGGFSWSYPITVPPAVAGPVPDLSLSYDSGSIDGLTANTNNQGSQVGEGFDLSSSSYIERKYGSCEDDAQTGKDDLCWKYDNASLVLNGQANELVKDPSDATGNTWRLKNDDATKVIRGHGAGSNDDGDITTDPKDTDGEFWKVVTSTGTTYTFGLNKLPGAPAGSETNSVWTAPVFGDDEGEPGYKKSSSFSGRAVQQAWRWNLDLVQDLQGNASTYWYTKEANYYAKNGDKTTAIGYNRGGYLNEIKYGQRADALFTGIASGRVEFTYTERCESGCSSLTEDTADNWPDVPFDTICAGGATDCKATGPSFFTRKRLENITTQVWSTALEPDAFTNVDSYALVSGYTAPVDLNDPSERSLVLKSIIRTGKNGTALKLNPVDFTYDNRPNRVDVPTDDILPINRPRIRTITSETGATTEVTLSDPQCVSGSKMPTAVDDNDDATRPCYPVKWKVNGGDTRLDWFHKYRVTNVTTKDAITAATVSTSYEYEKPGWRYNDDPMTKEKDRTWSSWRGYGRVTTYTGAGSNRSKTTNVYMQGMYGDKTADPKVTRTNKVPVIDIDGTGSIAIADYTDYDQVSGFLRQTVTYNGATVIGSSLNYPGYTNTATQTVYKMTDAGQVAKDSDGKPIVDKTITASRVRTSRTYSYAYLTTSDTFRRTQTDYLHDTYGMVTRVNALGDSYKSGDDTCTNTWYARNPAVGLTDLVSRTRTVAQACTDADGNDVTDDKLTLPSSLTTRGDVISDTATVYDDATVTGWKDGLVPTKGLATWTGRPKAYPAANGTNPRTPSETDGWQKLSSTTYDTLGRPLSATDAAGNTSTTAYTPATVGPLTASVSAKPVLDSNGQTHRTYAYFDPARGAVIRTVDAGSKLTTSAYDALGRVTGTWFGNRSQSGGESPNIKYGYSFQRGSSPWTSVTQLKHDNTTYQTPVYSITDSLLRPLQTQTISPNGGRILTDTRYDSRGLAYDTYADAWDDKNAPDGDYDAVTAGGPFPQTRTTFDGAGRPTTAALWVNGAKKWSTTTSYTGDSVATSAPDGGTAARIITDTLGRTTETRTYSGEQPDDAAYGATLGTAYTSVKYAYNRDGTPATISGPDGAKWSYTYDLFGRQRTATDPDSGTTTTNYSLLDQVSSTVDARGNTLLYAYDELGRKTGKWQTSRTDANKLAAWTYDTLLRGAPTAATSYVGGTTGKAYTKKIAAYDYLGRPSETELTLPADDPLVTSGAVSATTKYGTNLWEDGTVSSTSEPAAGGLPSETISTDYNSYLLPDGLSGTSGYVQSAGYSPLGRLERMKLSRSGALGVKDVDIANTFEEGTGRLKATTVYEPTHGLVQDSTYTHDDAGNVKSIFDKATVSGASAADYQCFTYDGQRRVTEAWTPKTADCATIGRTTANLGGPASYWKSYTYNAGGQRASETTHTSSATTDRTYCYDTTRKHALVSTTANADCTGVADQYTYDDGGNTTKRLRGPTTTTSQTLTWSGENKLSKLAEGTDTTTYLYDADGELFIRRNTGGETILYAGATEVHLEGTKKWANRYYTLGGQRVAVRSNETGTSKVSFLSGDHHGTSSVAIDSGDEQTVSKRYITPFGAPRGDSVGTWPDDKRFLGKSADTNTALTHIGAREYDPNIGQFISVDPLLMPDSPQSLNGYGYANNNPVTTADPTGRCAEIDCPTRPTTEQENTTPGNEPGQPKVSQGGSAPPAPEGQYKTTCGRFECKTKWVEQPHGNDKDFKVGLVLGAVQVLTGGCIEHKGLFVTQPCFGGVAEDHGVDLSSSAFEEGMGWGSLVGGARLGTFALRGAKAGPSGPVAGGKPVGPGWFPYGSAKVPNNWSGPHMTSKYKKNDNKAGFVWRAPRGQDSVRIDRGDLNSQWATQQVDHVVINSGGRIVGRGGELLPPNARIQDYPVEAHIPLSEWQTWRTWNAP